MRATTFVLWALTLVAFVSGDGCVKLDDVFDCAALCDQRPHAYTTCSGAGCVFERCADGYADCNQDLKDGCEVPLRTESRHCGVCENICAEATCRLGSCFPVEPLSDRAEFVKKMHLTGGTLYFARAKPRSGSTPVKEGGTEGDADDAGASGSLEMELVKWDLAARLETKIAPSLWVVTALASDADTLYVVDSQSGAGTNREDRVSRVPKAGGDLQQLALTRVLSQTLIVDADDVYWGAGSAGGVNYVAKTGGTVVFPDVTLPDPSYDLSPVYDLAAVGDELYLASDGGLGKVAKMGGPLAVLVTEQRGSKVVVDASHAYVVGFERATASRVLRKVPLGGGEATVLWRSRNLSFVTALAVDDSAFYIATFDSILRVPKDGGTEIVLAGAQECVTDVAVDAEQIYWSGCFGIRRLAKPIIRP